MKWLSRVLAGVVVAGTVVWGTTGCEDSGGGSSTPADVAGTWKGSSIGDDPANSDADITMALTQNGSSLAGNIDGAPLNGSVSGNSIVASFPGGEGDTVTLNGTVAGSTMSGTWESSTGERGTWTATKA